MKRQHVNSSSILTAGYEWDGAKGSGILDIEFTSTALYRYFDVPLEVWHAFMATDHKGGYFISRIRDRFRFECIYRPPRNKEKTNGTKDKEAIPTASSSQARTEKKKARIS